MLEHNFLGKWITSSEFYNLPKRNVFHRQFGEKRLNATEMRNVHVLFRKTFTINSDFNTAKIYISADDYYKLYINGNYVSEGPAPSYHFRYNYNVIDLSKHLKKGENVIAVHTLYHGLINRVWQSGDYRHGLILDLEVDDKIILCSDDSFKVKNHSGFKEIGIVGTNTNFLEEYDANSPENGFENLCFNDQDWEGAKYVNNPDYVLKYQTTKQLELEKITPIKTWRVNDNVIYDFGSNYACYLTLKIKGKLGDKAIIYMGQELNEDNSVRYKLRANCTYEETFILNDGVSTLIQFDYKSFRYVELNLPKDCEVLEVYIEARHYPFNLAVNLKKEYANNDILKRIFNLCVHTQKYGVQDAVLDCMEREKGCYLGDGCYTALTHAVLTGDDGIVRKLIDDAFSSSFITGTLVTCLNCSFMQEIAEYPLMLVKLILWHYRCFGDKNYLCENYKKVVSLLDSYKNDYEDDYLLTNLDKWCVVEWPMNFRDGYDAVIDEGKICSVKHVAINAYYIDAIKFANEIAKILNLPIYRDEKPIISAFYSAFYDAEKHLFKDAVGSNHISMIGNIFPFAFELIPDEKFTQNVLDMIKTRKLSSVSLFGAFPLLEGLVRNGKKDLIKEVLLDEGAYIRMLNEGATTTFEGWGRDTKWNTSLFHLTMSYGALFMIDTDIEKIL